MDLLRFNEETTLNPRHLEAGFKAMDDAHGGALSGHCTAKEQKAWCKKQLEPLHKLYRALSRFCRSGVIPRPEVKQRL